MTTTKSDGSTAPEFLKRAADLMIERGKQYDKPEGERSMGVAVSAFNTITGQSLTEAEGWLLLQVLKDVRQWQNPDKYHADSAEDCIAYAALKAEALASADRPAPAVNNPDRVRIYEKDSIEPAAAIEDDSPRMQAIGQNGNTGEHYDEWPEWATHKLTTGPKWIGNISTIGSVEFARLEGGNYLDAPGEDACQFGVGDESWVVLEARPSCDRPQWGDAPDDMMWLACDSDNSSEPWWWFENEPSEDSDGVFCNSGNVTECTGKYPAIPGFKEARPCQ